MDLMTEFDPDNTGAFQYKSILDKFDFFPQEDGRAGLPKGPSFAMVPNSDDQAAGTEFGLYFSTCDNGWTSALVRPVCKRVDDAHVPFA